jgi:DNA-binding transcriptional MocR family regulator
MKMFIQRNSPLPLHQQIYHSIRDQIVSGLLTDGDQLPSIRQLAQQLQVSPMTVVQAYRLLEKENWIVQVQGKGSFVRTQEPSEETQPSPFAWQKKISNNLIGARYPSFYHWPVEYPMADSVIDPELLPNLFIEQELIKLLSQDPRSLSRYSEIQGDFHLRSAISKYLQKLSIHTSPEEILITNGTQQAIDLVTRTFLQPGDLVVTEAPTYAAALDLFKSQGVTLLSVPVDEEGMKISNLMRIFSQKTPKLIYTIPSFQNPSGVTMSRKRRQQLIELVQNTTTLILEDDPWSELYFEKKPPEPLFSMDTQGHVIYIKGLSKILAPSCRIGILLARGPIFHQLLTMKGNVDLGNPLLTQKAILSIIQTERMQRHLEKLRIALQLRRDYLIYCLQVYMPAGVKWHKPLGGLNLWVELPEKVNALTITEQAKEQSVSVLPGTICYPYEEGGDRFLRLTFASLNEKKIEEAIRRLGVIIYKALNAPSAFANA